ncbi:hypothetical protein D3C87_1658170 [compost metagenome]
MRRRAAISRRIMASICWLSRSSWAIAASASARWFRIRSSSSAVCSVLSWISSFCCLMLSVTVAMVWTVAP